MAKAFKPLPDSFLYQTYSYLDGYMSGVYLLYDQGKLVYIGRSRHIPNRIPAHFPDKVFDRVYVHLCSYEKAIELENCLIYCYAPKYNLRCERKPDLWLSARDRAINARIRARYGP